MAEENPKIESHEALETINGLIEEDLDFHVQGLIIYSLNDHVPESVEDILMSTLVTGQEVSVIESIL